MRTPQIITETAKMQLEDLLNKSKTKMDFRRVECLWLRAKFEFTPSQIAIAVGLKENTVKQIQSNFFRNGETALIGTGRGGDHHRNLSTQEEDELLQPFFEKASQGGILVVTEIKIAYEKKVGHSVPRSTVYRMLDRHGWRKIAPRPVHPNADDAVLNAREDFKKTS